MKIYNIVQPLGPLKNTKAYFAAEPTKCAVYAGDGQALAIPEGEAPCQEAHIYFRELVKQVRLGLRLRLVNLGQYSIGGLAEEQVVSPSPGMPSLPYFCERVHDKLVPLDACVDI